MRDLGFREFLDSSHSGYIITSYCFPDDPNFSFTEFYRRLNDKGMCVANVANSYFINPFTPKIPHLESSMCGMELTKTGQ
jgi:hypothetical protein